MVPRTLYMHFLALFVRYMAQTGAKMLLILAQVEAPNFLIPINASGYLVVSWQAWHGMGIFDALGWYFWFVARFAPSWYQLSKIREYCNSLNYFFTIIAFALVVHLLEKYSRKHFSFKHTSMVQAIFILVVFQVLAAFNSPHLLPPPPPDTKRKYEETEGGQ